MSRKRNSGVIKQLDIAKDAITVDRDAMRHRRIEPPLFAEGEARA